MALHNLKITVVNGGKSVSSWGGKPINATADTKKKPENSMLYKALNYNQTIRNKMAKATSPTTFFALQSGIGLATQTARQGINYYVSDIGRRNGDSNYQAIINRRIEVATDIASLVGGALSGAAAGSALPGVGTAIGAAVGAASAGVSLGFKYAERDRAFAHKMFQENNSIAYSVARTSYTGFTGRLR